MSVAAVSEPMFPVAAKKLVEEAIVEKKLVEVALVVVALRAVKFWRVEDAVVRKPPSLFIWKSSVPAELTKLKNLPRKEGVEEALMRVPVVPVAFTWKSADLSREGVVVAPITNDLYGEEVAERKSPPETSAKDWPKEAEPVSSASQPNVPPDQVKTLLDWQVVRPAPLKRAVKRLVDEAVVLNELVEVAAVVVERVMLSNI